MTMTKRELSQELQTAGFLLANHRRKLSRDLNDKYDHRQNNPLRRGVKWQQHRPISPSRV